MIDPDFIIGSIIPIVMSKEAFQLAIGKAILDTEFRQALFSEPEQALLGFKLTLAEKISLKRLDSETLELLARLLHTALGKYHQGVIHDSKKRVGKNKIEGDE